MPPMAVDEVAAEAELAEWNETFEVSPGYPTALTVAFSSGIAGSAVMGHDVPSVGAVICRSMRVMVSSSER